MTTSSRRGWIIAGVATGVLVLAGGEGIAEADRERIFEPFYRVAGTRQVGRGFGLGLAMVRRIARAHGGDVTYAPVTGGGSRFSVTLP